ncbi:MAG: flagellar biosynthetic protein FliR [Christensenellales bacterium]|jgi:flagellar biosynthetic protein FliR
MTHAALLFYRIEWFILILLRVSGFVFVSPVFGRRGVPAPAKIVLSVLLAYFVYAVRGEAGGLPHDPWMFAALCARETVMGIALGFVTTIFFSAFTTAGQIIDTGMGLGMGGIYDPQMESSTPLTGNLITAAAFLSFLCANGHLTLIRILYELFGAAPVLGGTLGQAACSVLMGGFACAFLFAVKLALPMMTMMLFCEFIMGVMVKFVPQLNVFVIGMPLKILVGMMVMLLMAAPLGRLFDGLFEELFSYSRSIVQSMA